MKNDATKEMLAIVVNMYRASVCVPFRRIEDARKGPTAIPMNLAELRKPIDVPFLPDFPPRRQGGMPDWTAPIMIRRTMN